MSKLNQRDSGSCADQGVEGMATKAEVAPDQTHLQGIRILKGLAQFVGCQLFDRTENEACEPSGTWPRRTHHRLRHFRYRFTFLANVARLHRESHVRGATARFLHVPEYRTTSRRGYKQPRIEDYSA